MNAIIYQQYGPPDVLQLAQVEIPELKKHEVLVKNEALSVNPSEWHSLNGEHFMARLEPGLLRPKHPILGADLAGRVEAVGSKVTRFRPGDEVYGRSLFGGFAEFVSVPEDRLASKPAKLSFEQAAAVPLAALTGLQALRNGDIRWGHKVLINGASGGIGTFAVQLAKSMGAEVTGVCSTRNLDLVRSIGADHAIDYTLEKIGENGDQYDLVLDVVGNLVLADYRRALRPNGRAVVIGFEDPGRMFKIVLQSAWASVTSGQKIGLMLANTNHEDLDFIRKVIEAGLLTPVIDRCYPFDQLPEALRHLGTKRARGKIVIGMGAKGVLPGVGAMKERRVAV